MWRELIRSLFMDAKFREPARKEQLELVARELRVELPPELADLLAETNGVRAHYSAPLVWSVEEIVDENRAFRSNQDFVELYMPFDDLLFFGGDGGGNQFAYRILAGRIPETSWIYRWDHEDDSREWFASNLKDYLQLSVPKDE